MCHWNGEKLLRSEWYIDARYQYYNDGPIQCSGKEKDLKHTGSDSKT